MKRSESPLATSTKGPSVLDELAPDARDKALTSLVRVYDALDDFARALREGETRDHGRRYEVRERVNEIVRDAAGLAVSAFRAGYEYPASDRHIAAVMASVAGYTRHLIHAVGADHVVKIRDPMPGSSHAGSGGADRNEYWLHLLRMTPDQALAQVTQEKARWTRLENTRMETVANPSTKRQRGLER